MAVKKTGDTVSAEEILGEFEPQAVIESNHSQENAHHDYNEQPMIKQQDLMTLKLVF